MTRSRIFSGVECAHATGQQATTKQQTEGGRDRNVVGDLVSPKPATSVGQVHSAGPTSTLNSCTRRRCRDRKRAMSAARRRRRILAFASFGGAWRPMDVISVIGRCRIGAILNSSNSSSKGATDSRDVNQASGSCVELPLLDVINRVGAIRRSFPQAARGNAASV